MDDQRRKVEKQLLRTIRDGLQENIRAAQDTGDAVEVNRLKAEMDRVSVNIRGAQVNKLRDDLDAMVIAQDEGGIGM